MMVAAPAGNDERMASNRRLSTRLFRLLFSRLARSRNTSNKSSRRRNDICFLATPFIFRGLVYVLLQI